MPACKNVPNLFTHAARLLGVLSVLATPIAAAQFSVHEVQAKIVDEALQLNTRIDLALTAKTEEALAKGIPLDLIIEVQLIRRRTLLWDKRVADWQLRRRIQYHALSGLYLVSGLHPDVYDLASFDTLASALSHIGALQDAELPLTKNKNISSDDSHSLELRVYLDLEALPSLLRPVAYTSPSWYLSSGWTTWTVQH